MVSLGGSIAFLTVFGGATAVLSTEAIRQQDEQMHHDMWDVTSRPTNTTDTSMQEAQGVIPTGVEPPSPIKQRVRGSRPSRYPDAGKVGFVSIDSSSLENVDSTLEDVDGMDSLDRTRHRYYDQEPSDSKDEVSHQMLNITPLNLNNEFDSIEEHHDPVVLESKDTSMESNGDVYSNIGPVNRSGYYWKSSYPKRRKLRRRRTRKFKKLNRN